MENALREITVVDALEARILEIGGDMRERGGANSITPLQHFFTPGLYIRQIFMPAGALIVTEIHKTTHPYVVSAGRCLVYLEKEKRWDAVEAPHFGITTPGTRRFLIVVFDTVWTTFHPTNKTDVLEIENEILEPRGNPLLAAREITA